MKGCFVNKLTTSTKMNYLGGMVCCGGRRRWVLGHMPCKGCVLRILLGWPLRIKGINMASMLRCTSSAAL
jgi:hypothetical protein